jgi:putative ABC transport system substrate-binding protein
MNRRDLVLLLAGALTAARALGAQKKTMPVIGFLNGTSPSAAAPFVTAFHKGLSEAGYVEGRDIVIEYRWAGIAMIGWRDWPPSLSAARWM